MESIPTDNARLTAAIRDGSREAFDEMCGRYYAPLMAYARLFLKGNWAQDIVRPVSFQKETDRKSTRLNSSHP